MCKADTGLCSSIMPQVLVTVPVFALGLLSIRKGDDTDTCYCAALIFRHPPARLLAMIARNISTRASSLMGSPS